jgi:hypothetical protein
MYINAGRILQSMLPTGNHRVGGCHIRPDYVPLPDTLRVKTPFPMFRALERKFMAFRTEGEIGEINVIVRPGPAWPAIT